MKRIILKNKPLVEAIFELRWELPLVIDENMKKDPNYPLLIGTLYENIKNEYPFHEELPSTSIPPEMAAHIVQHRFRKDKDEWPLVQLGPGIITINDTINYIWKDFRERIFSLIDIFYKIYPNSEKLEISELQLRYIDAVPFNYSENVLYFLKDKLKFEVKLHEPIFEGVKVNDTPTSIDFRCVYKTDSPRGSILLQFVKGKKADGEEGLVWNIIIRSRGDEVSTHISELKKWVDDAHTLSNDWFFKLIDGELLERFK